MPQIGHALIGLGVGAATACDVRSARLRDAWPGLCVALAYGPDLLEWALVWTPAPVVHGVTASLAATFAASVAIALLIRGVARESWWVALVALLTWGSHTLADSLAGGVPLFWPWSHATAGSDWLELDVGSWSQRLGREVRWLLPVLVLGLSSGAVRRTADRRVRGAGFVSVTAALVSAALNWVLLGLLAAVLAVLAYAVSAGPSRWRVLGRSAIALGPMWLMAGAQVHGWYYVREAEARYRDRDYTGAIASYSEAARFRPVDGLGRSIVMTALCHRRMGEYGIAEQLYRAGLERFPESLTGMYGLGLLYLDSTDPAYRRPAAAIALFERLLARSTDPEQRDQLRRLIERAAASIAP